MTIAVRMLIAVSLMLLSAGCAGQPGEAKTPGKSVSSPNVKPTAAKPAAAAKLVAATTHDAAIAAPEKVAAAPTAPVFTPPFPHRANPFVQPDQATVDVAVQIRRTESDEKIQLKGFVTVDRPKALLRIDGRVWAAHEGATRDGIAVVRIQPAAVTLERDGVQWDILLRKDG